MAKPINKEYARIIFEAAKTGLIGIHTNDGKPIFIIPRKILNKHYFNAEHEQEPLQRKKYNQVSFSEHGFLNIAKASSWSLNELPGKIAKRDMFTLDATEIFKAIGQEGVIDQIVAQGARRFKD
ncbi:MAG: DUF5118 domain-containing protein [Rickettsiales bacterium]|nr:DUF5118 domain-containing protein [Rickettsiales bacterium]